MFILLLGSIKREILLVWRQTGKTALLTFSFIKSLKFCWQSPINIPWKVYIYIYFAMSYEPLSLCPAFLGAIRTWTVWFYSCLRWSLYCSLHPQLTSHLMTVGGSETKNQSWGISRVTVMATYWWKLPIECFRWPAVCCLPVVMSSFQKHSSMPLLWGCQSPPRLAPLSFN